MSWLSPRPVTHVQAGICLAVTLAAIAAVMVPDAAAKTPPLEPVALRTVPVPDHLRDPQFPYYTRDGKHLVFAFTNSSRYAGAHIATITTRGRRFRCLTCQLGAVSI